VKAIALVIPVAVTAAFAVHSGAACAGEPPAPPAPPVGEVKDLFSNMSRGDKNAWGRLFTAAPPEREKWLSEKARSFGCTQESKGGTYVWRGRDGDVRLMLVHVPDPREFDVVAGIYDDIAKHKPPLTFAIVNQRPDGGGEWDLFRLTPSRYMGHLNRISVKRAAPAATAPPAPAEKREPKRPVREDIRRMFSHMPTPQVDLAWTEAFFCAPGERARLLGVIARGYGCTVKTEGRAHLWVDAEGAVQAMFAVPDPGKLQDFRTLYADIRKHQPPITYVAVRDSGGMACIFGLWEGSYLNHHNQLPKTDVAVRRFFTMEASGLKVRVGRPLPEELAAPATVLAGDVMNLYGKVMAAAVDAYGQTRPELVADLVCMRAAGIDVDYETLMTLSGRGITFAYDRQFEFWRPEPAPKDARERIERDGGFKAEPVRFASAAEAWNSLKAAVDAGRPLRAKGGRRVYAGYRDAKTEAGRMVFVIEPPWVRAVSWDRFARWHAKPGEFVSYKKGARKAEVKEVAVEVMADIVQWSRTHPKVDHWAYGRSVFGIAGIEAYAADIGDAAKPDTYFTGGWRGGRHIYPLWTGRKCAAVYLKRAAGEFPAEVKSHLVAAVKAYEAAHAEWLVWEKHLGRKAPLRCWSSEVHREAGAAAVRKAAEHEKKAVAAVEKAHAAAVAEEAF